MDDWGVNYGADREERAERLRNGIIPATVPNGAQTVRLRIQNPEIPQDFPTIRQMDQYGLGNIPQGLRFPIPERDVFHLTNQTRYIETFMYANRADEHVWIRSQRYGEPNFAVFENRKYYVLTLDRPVGDIIINNQQDYDILTCTCDDFYYRSGLSEDNLDPNFMCKHMMAIEYALDNSEQYREQTELWNQQSESEEESEEEFEEFEEFEEEEVIEDVGVGGRVAAERNTRQRRSTRDPDFEYSNVKMDSSEFLVNVFKLLKISKKK